MGTVFALATLLLGPIQEQLYYSSVMKKLFLSSKEEHNIKPAKTVKIT